jgi:hypothetical protein
VMMISCDDDDDVQYVKRGKKLIAAVLSYEVLQLEYLDRLDSRELWVASS